MENQFRRIFLFVALSIVGLHLFTSWQEEKLTQAKPQKTDIAKKSELGKFLADANEAKNTAIIQHQAIKQVPNNRIIKVETDLFFAEIDKKGGDIVRLELREYPEEIGAEKGVSLLDFTEDNYFVAQSGFIAEGGPDSAKTGRVEYSAQKNQFKLESGSEKLIVPLVYRGANGSTFVKKYEFKRGSYTLGVGYSVTAGSKKVLGSPYGRLKRRHIKDKSSAIGMRGYNGAAYQPKGKAFQKLPFKDFSSKAINTKVDGGWAAIVDHYFLGAFVPPAGENRYITEKLENDIYAIGFIAPQVELNPGEKFRYATKLYLGPENQHDLAALAKGLELTVDYGVLWPICQPIFWLLQKVYSVVGNWGLAIIGTTLIIKLLLFKLSATSYRSMGNMRKLQPKIEELKSKYSEDKQRFGQAMIELYRREKVSPFGGCLPLLLQMPIFIALYFVLISSVELRQAPFALWIMDLSARDPYYILPLLNGATMFIQQKLNPAPPDPVQAKVMTFMPVMFTFLFLNLPAGLMLYWVVNNLLSMMQQLYVTRGINK